MQQLPRADRRAGAVGATAVPATGRKQLPQHPAVGQRDPNGPRSGKQGRAAPPKRLSSESIQLEPLHKARHKNAPGPLGGGQKKRQMQRSTHQPGKKTQQKFLALKDISCILRSMQIPFG